MSGEARATQLLQNAVSKRNYIVNEYITGFFIEVSRHCPYLNRLNVLIK